jgi:Glycosyltransferase family 87
MTDVAVERTGRRRLTMWDAVRHGLWIGLVPIEIWYWLVQPLLHGEVGWDSRAYWGVWRNGIYTHAPGTLDAFNYSPAFAQVIWPLTLLPWPAFVTVWSSLLVACLAWLTWPMGRKWGPLVFVLCLPTAITIGNVDGFLAVVAALGLRRSGMWVLPALTKVVPTMGPLWFAARREWRPLAKWGLLLALLIGVSAAANPGLWVQWADFVRTAPPPAVGRAYGPLWIRAAGATALVIWGARSDRRWTIPVAMVLASPLPGPQTLVILTALGRLHVPQRGRAVEVMTAEPSTG